MANTAQGVIDSLPLRLWQRMFRIRAVEEQIALVYKEGKMRCPTHLSIGQEAVPSAMAEHLEVTDYAVSTHRGHAHYLAKGGNLNAMIAELHGKATGCCGGRGGSMHLVDTSVGFMGTTAIVGNSIPLGVGLALSAQIKNTEQISCIYLGDGAVEEGVFYESVNFAVVKNLRVIFVCENNLYSVYSPLSVRQPKNRKIHEMVRAMGIETQSCDGNDALDVANVVSDAVLNVRTSSRPMFLEFATYRWREHCGADFDDHLGYRPEDELEYWLARDPIALLEKSLIEDSKQIKNSLALYKETVHQEIKNAFDFAETSPYAKSGFAYENVYAE
jgi:TPP-dependent pyruvate/acetoin dehydrogenase alpha subunit